MAAIMEAALAQIRRKLDEAGFNLAQTEVMQTEHLYSRAINQMGAGIKVIQTCVGGGVLA
jgi:hypothetical protein